MRKKIVLFAAAALALASCTSDLSNRGNDPTKLSNTIGFQVGTENVTRATPLHQAEHYNFGVFAYKSTDLVNPVMPNYLVGYKDDAKGYQQAGTTVGDQEGLYDGQSYWMYEGMGNAEYNGTYAGGALTPAYTSNNANQYLKYWDNAAATTAFYAYAPYINSGVKSTVTYVDGTAQSATGNDTYVMCFPDGTIEAGMDNAALSEYMYAYNKVAKANYGHDVALNFQRLNAKVNIKFWEDIPGWKVRILDLSSSHSGVQAAAAIKDGTSGDFGYKGGKFYKKNGVKISFATTPEVIKQFVGTVQTNSEPLVFAAPTDAQIGENRYAASASASTYYAIPKGQGSNLLAGTSTNFSDAGAAEDGDFALTGFTFHVSYELTAEDTGEKIVVNNATVFVPADYANWKANTHYTYIFKITKNSNGTTEDPTQPGGPTIDPTDPEVPTTQSLYPIVFDNCTVTDWETNESEWVISDGTSVIYHDVQLFADAAHTTSKYSLAMGDLYLNITNNDTYAGATIDYNAVTITPADANISYDANNQKITVAAGAAAGVYTVTYTCPATYDQTTHPSTWTETFVVGNEYIITTHRDVIGTNSNKTEAKLNVTGTKDNVAETLTSANLSIDYPANFEDADKAHVAISGTDVVVKSSAKPGVYKVVYKVNNVKVAEKEFTVVDYSLTLSHTTVFNTVGGTTVTGNKTADANHVYTVNGPTSHTATVTDGTANIVVPNNSLEGTYTVTYTVYGGQADETVYTKTFVVKNTHKVEVSKTAIDRNVGTSNVGDLTTDNIVVTTTFNGVDTNADLTAKLSVVKLAANGAETATAAGDFSIVYDSANKHNLKVKNNVATGDYYVKFVQTVGGTDKAEYVHFVVTE